MINHMLNKRTCFLRSVRQRWITPTGKRLQSEDIRRSTYLLQNNFFQDHFISYFFKILQPRGKKNRTSFILQKPKAFLTRPSLRPPLFGDKVSEAPLSWMKSMLSDCFITAVAAIVVDSIKLAWIHPQWRTSCCRERLRSLWWLPTPHPTRKKNSCCLTSWGLQRNTKSWSQTFLAVWWYTWDTGNCLCVFQKWKMEGKSHTACVFCYVTVCLKRKSEGFDKPSSATTNNNVYT